MINWSCIIQGQSRLEYKLLHGSFQLPDRRMQIGWLAQRLMDTANTAGFILHLCLFLWLSTCTTIIILASLLVHLFAIIQYFCSNRSITVQMSYGIACTTVITTDTFIHKCTTASASPPPLFFFYLSYGKGSKHNLKTELHVPVSNTWLLC